MRTAAIPLLAVAAFAATIHAAEFHVATNGNDANRGTAAAPLRTIQHAAELAQPGDVITVHAGTYRERINPPRGGESDAKRIVYQAAPGEKVEIKGSEVVTGWVKVQDDVWKVTLPNSFFGDFNPYSDVIRGDWFEPKGRVHHTGAVYLNGDWLTEAVTLDEVLMPAGTSPAWLSQPSQQYLLNVAWLRPGDGTGDAQRIPATSFAAKTRHSKRTLLRGRRVYRLHRARPLGPLRDGLTSARSTRTSRRFVRRQPQPAGSSRCVWMLRTANCWEPVRSPTQADGSRGLRSRPRSSR